MGGKNLERLNYDFFSPKFSHIFSLYKRERRILVQSTMLLLIADSRECFSMHLPFDSWIGREDERGHVAVVVWIFSKSFIRDVMKTKTHHMGVGLVKSEVRFSSCLFSILWIYFLFFVFLFFKISWMPKLWLT